MIQIFVLFSFCMHCYGKVKPRGRCPGCKWKKGKYCINSVEFRAVHHTREYKTYTVKQIKLVFVIVVYRAPYMDQTVHGWVGRLVAR